MKDAKRLLRKEKETGGDLYLAVLALRNTPTEAMDTSPTQRLLGRRCKTQLPTTTELLTVDTGRNSQTTNQEQATETGQVLQQRDQRSSPSRGR